MRRLAILLALSLAGCAGTTASVPTPPQAACRSEAVTRFIGQTATADLGAQMLAASGARSLRWMAPGMAVTMDFRPDRLSVGYDEKMVIQTASCG